MRFILVVMLFLATLTTFTRAESTQGIIVNGVYKSSIALTANPHALTKKHRKSFIGHVFHEISHGHVKAILVAVSSMLVFLEVFEEVAREIPYLEKIVGHQLAKVHHGVFLLTLSHLVTTISEVIKQVQENIEIKHTIKAEEYVHHLAHEEFENEKTAAIAYDRAAIRAYGRGAATNFPYAPFKSYIHLDHEGKLPEKSSQYRGVVWSNERKCWLVSPAAFGMEEEN